MSKLTLCVLFGGMSPEHAVSLRSAASVLAHVDSEKYQTLMVGITREGKWLLYQGDSAKLPDGSWEQDSGNLPAFLSPVRGQGLVVCRESGMETIPVDVVFPVLHGENGEDGAMQGLLQMAGIPYVGPQVAASAVAMDKTLTKLVADQAGVPQAQWELVRGDQLHTKLESILERLESRFTYPMFVKPAGTGSSVGVSKAKHRKALVEALENAAKYDRKILVEEFIQGREIEVAVLGNDEPVASVCGEISSGAEFYDYEAKYITDTSEAFIPARISEEAQERVRRQAIRVYRAIGCRGLSRVDFFVSDDEERVVFNEINTLPGFTSISMYPKLFEASGVPYSQLIDRLIALAMEEEA